MGHRRHAILADILAGVLKASADQDDASTPSGNSAVAEPAQPKRATSPGARKRRKQQSLPPWNVVLLDDDEHTYQYVIEMLGRLFGHNTGRAFQMAREVDATGRVIVMTTHRELAELKREQILRYGLDPRIQSCRGSMRALIEPAPG